MINIVILEDEQQQANHLLSLLKRYRLQHPDFVYQATWYDSALKLLSEYRCDADLMLMDIQMPDMLGMDAAKRVRQMDDKVMIIFITTLTQYAIEGYAVGAFDYVLKPVNDAVFAAKMDRALRSLSYRHCATTIEIRNKEKMFRLSADDITYIEVAGHDVLIHTPSQVYRQWGTLKQFAETLEKDHFVRCNACYLVNLRYVHGVEADQAIVHEDRLTISKPRRKDFLMAIAQYKGGSR